jgi:HlyD family secretion protein
MQPSPLTPPTVQPAPHGPMSVPPAAVPEPPPSNWMGRIVNLAIVAGLVVASWWIYQRLTAPDAAATQAVAQLRTYSVSTGAVARSIRVTGITAAEKYSSIIAPQMRSSRSGRGRDASATRLETPSLPSIRRTSSRTPTGMSGSSNGATSGGDASGGAQSVASNSSAIEGGAAAAGGGGGARGGGTSRMASGGARSSGGGASASQGRISTGTASLGSTESQLGQGMGGGGGGGAPSGGGGGGSSRGGGFSRFGSGGEFALTLQTLAKPGSRVHKGDTVAEFDRQYMLQRLEDYKSSVAQYEANMKKLKADLDLYKVQHAQTIEIAKGELDKAELDLKTTPVRGDMDRERLKLAYEEAKAQHEQLKAEVRFVEISTGAQLRNSEFDYEQAQLELKRAESNSERMLVKAPIDGIVVMQQTFAGSEFRQIQQGDQVFSGQFFMQIVEPGSMVVNASVNQVDGENLRVGAKTKVRFDAYPGLELPGHVVSVAAVTKTGGFRATYLKEIPVLIKLDKMDDRVIPDLSVSCDVIVEESAGQGTVVAPLEGLFADAAPGSQRFVYVREGQGEKTVWRRRQVEVGLASFTHATIRSGLNPGEVIALDEPPSSIRKT